MNIQVLEKEWELKKLTPKEQRKMYARFMSLQPEFNEDGESSREQTQEEKEKLYELFFESIEVAGVEAPENIGDQLVLGMAIVNHYLGFDKKKLSNAESEDG